jgi:hypothetical protein
LLLEPLYVITAPSFVITAPSFVITAQAVIHFQSGISGFPLLRE